MKLVGDISCFQTHNWEWTSWQPIDLVGYAQSVDAVWVRWSDWSNYVKWGKDPGYEHCINTFRDLGKPVGGYLFPRPGWTNPAEQVKTWHSQTPPTTFAPMLDPEDPEGMSGAALTGWLDTALAEMAQLWQTTPWLYTQASKAREWGLGRPSTPHHLILSEYHFGYDPFAWSSRSGWEQRAYSKYGGPDLPAGWDHYDAWQFTSSAEVPGMAGLVDASWMAEEAFARSTSGGALGAAMDDGFTADHARQLADIHQAFVG